MKREDAFSGTQDLTGELRIPPDVINIHRHAEGVHHFHGHSHAGEENAHDPERHHHPHRLSLRALLVGMVHGLAGSAALMLLTVETLQSVVLGLVYIALFSVGALVGTTGRPQFVEFFTYW